METVLLVDDDLDLDALLKEVFRMAGWNTLIATSGAAAWQATEQAGAGDGGPALPALIVLDLDLPDMSGEQVHRGLLRRLGAPVPVLVVSGSAQCAERAASLGLPWLRKPFEVEDLLGWADRARAAGPGETQTQT